MLTGDKYHRPWSDATRNADQCLRYLSRHKAPFRRRCSKYVTDKYKKVRCYFNKFPEAGCKAETRRSLNYSQLSLSRSFGDYFLQVQITRSANKFGLRVNWTCKKVSDAKLGLEKAIKMYYRFR